MGQKLVPEIAPVDIEGSRLPDALVALERGLRDGLEEGLSRIARRILPEVDRGDDFHRPRPRLADIHGCDVAHDLPDAFATVLAMHEEALASGGQDTEAETPQLAVADIVGDLAGLQRADAGVGESVLDMSSLPVAVATREPGADRSVRMQQLSGEKATLYHIVSTVRCVVRGVQRTAQPCCLPLGPAGLTEWRGWYWVECENTREAVGIATTLWSRPG